MIPGRTFRQEPYWSGSFRKVKLPGDTVTDFCPVPAGGWLIADPVRGVYATTYWSRLSHRDPTAAV